MKSSAVIGGASLFINPVEFQKAGVNLYENHLSTPFTCPNPYRTDERAIVLLANGQVWDVSLSEGCINPDGSVNLEAVEYVYQSPVEKVIYRPNHELLHSLRQPGMVLPIKEYYDRNAPGKFDTMELKHLERLQLMLLCSVSGRKDETGFHDSKDAKENLYAKYRADSAKNFLEYVQQHRPDLYDLNEREQLYHDALMVELMGAPVIPTDEDLLKDVDNPDKGYVMVKRIKEYGLELPNRVEKFPGVYLEFLNIAHSLDLLRVYPPNSADAANSKKNIEKLLGDALRSLKKEGGLNEANIKNAIRDTISLIKFARNLLDESGEKTTTMLKNVDDHAIAAMLNDPTLNMYIQSITSDPTISAMKLNEMKDQISNFIGTYIFELGDYNYSPKRFDYCHYKGNSNRDKDRDFAKEVTSGVSMINSVARPQYVSDAKATMTAGLVSSQPAISTSTPAPSISTMQPVSVGPGTATAAPTAPPPPPPLKPASLGSQPMTATPVVPPLSSLDKQKLYIREIIKANIKALGIQPGEWPTVEGTPSSIVIEFGISGSKGFPGVTIQSANSKYLIVLENDNLIIRDNKNYVEITDPGAQASILATLSNYLPDQYKKVVTTAPSAPPVAPAKPIPPPIKPVGASPQPVSVPPPMTPPPALPPLLTSLHKQKADLQKNILMEITKAGLQKGGWITLVDTTSIRMDVGISNSTNYKGLSLIDIATNNKYLIALEQDQLIIRDKNNTFTEITDPTIQAMILNKISSNLSPATPAPIAVIPVAPAPAIHTPVAPMPTVATPVMPPPKSAPPPKPKTAAPMLPLSKRDEGKKPTFDYDAYVKAIKKLVIAKAFLQGKRLHVKSGAIGELFKPDSRPPIIQEIKAILKQNEKNDSKDIFQLIKAASMNALTAHVAASNTGEKTHNSDPDTINFMQALTNLTRLENYLGSQEMKSAFKKTTMGGSSGE